MANTPVFVQPGPLERLFNRIFGLLVGWGIGPSYAYVLQVEGRRSRRIYSTPVSVLDYKGKRLLVAPRGETQWVRNAKVSGHVWLKKGRSRQRYVVKAVDDRDKPEILREYLNRYRVAVQRYFSVPVDAPLEAFSNITRQYPVFELIAQ
jgi:deazaflavin-dependent oxidoreductase (nitroreductase family)